MKPTYVFPALLAGAFLLPGPAFGQAAPAEMKAAALTPKPPVNFGDQLRQAPVRAMQMPLGGSKTDERQTLAALVESQARLIKQYEAKIELLEARIRELEKK